MCLKRKTDGELIVDLSGDSVPVQLKLNIGINDIIQKKFIRLKTQVINLNIPVEYADDQDLHSV